jgi:ubiquinone biosynthesis protein UbiJ
MNGDNQPQQEQHRLSERVARVETAVDYLGKALSDLREEMRAGFARLEARLDRLEEQHNRDFRILLGISMTTVFGLIGLIVKAFG